MTTVLFVLTGRSLSSPDSAAAASLLPGNGHEETRRDLAAARRAARTAELRKVERDGHRLARREVARRRESQEAVALEIRDRAGDLARLRPERENRVRAHAVRREWRGKEKRDGQAPSGHDGPFRGKNVGGIGNWAAGLAGTAERDHDEDGREGRQPRGRRQVTGAGDREDDEGDERHGRKDGPEDRHLLQDDAQRRLLAGPHLERLVARVLEGLDVSLGRQTPGHPEAVSSRREIGKAPGGGHRATHGLLARAGHSRELGEDGKGDHAPGVPLAGLLEDGYGESARWRRGGVSSIGRNVERRTRDADRDAAVEGERREDHEDEARGGAEQRASHAGVLSRSMPPWCPPGETRFP